MSVNPDVRLSAAIMTHPSRVDRARRIAHEAIGIRPRLVLDPAPGLAPATLRTARAAWAAVEPGATHHLVLTDDAIVEPGFYADVRRAVSARPACPHAFFTEWGARTSGPIRIAALCGRPWTEVVDKYIPDQALVLPADLSLELADHLGTLQPDTISDNAIRDFLVARGITVLASVPSLVDHDDRSSLVGNHPHGLRRAVCRSPRSSRDAASGGEPLTGLTLVPFFAWWTVQAECWIRDTPDAREWRHEPAADTFARLGISVDEPLAKALPMLGDLTRLLWPAVLADLWRTGWLIGSIAAEHGAGNASLDDPLARSALRSMAPGALRRVINPDTAHDTYDMLSEFVAASVRSGLAKEGLPT